MLGSGAGVRMSAGLGAALLVLGIAPGIAAAATKPAPVRVVVTSLPRTVTAAGSKTKPVDRVVIRGHVVPASGRVVLQRLSGRQWIDVTEVRIGQAGTFTLVGQRLAVGRHTLRVVRAAEGKVKAVATRSFVVTVRAPSAVTQPVPVSTPGPSPAPPPAPAPTPTPAPPLPQPIADPPVTPTCGTSSAGDANGLQAYISDVLGYVGSDWSTGIGVFDDGQTWTAAATGALPPGITQTGTLFSGVPTQAGVFRFSVTVTDHAGDTVDLPVCLQFAQPLSLATATMPTAQVGQPYDQPIPLAGGFLPVSLDSVSVAGAKQDGFELWSTYRVQGTPTLAGSKTLDLIATDPTHMFANLAVTVPVGPLPANPHTWHVPGDAATIQGAIDLAQPGDTVLVAAGTYHEDIDFDGKDIAVRSVSGPAVTVIQGDGDRAVVGFHHGESRDAVIDGFTITGGADGSAGTDGLWVGEGGGVDIDFASPTVEHNIVVDNIGGSGSGISASGGSPLIRDNDIADNTAASTGPGGGLFVSNTDAADILGNTIENNDWQYGDGGGASLAGDDLLFQDNVVSGNHVRGYTNGVGAAGLLVNGAPGMRLVDDVVSGNVGFDAVVVSGGDAAVQLTGLTIDRNAGIGLFLADGFGHVTVTDTVVSGTPNPVGCGTTTGLPSTSQPATFDHDDIAGAAVPPACGSFSVAAGDSTATPDYQPGSFVPAAGSALVDAGTTVPSTPATDLVGSPRVVDGDGNGTATVDIGALERQ